MRWIGAHTAGKGCHGCMTHAVEAPACPALSFVFKAPLPPGRVVAGSAPATPPPPVTQPPFKTHLAFRMSFQPSCGSTRSHAASTRWTQRALTPPAWGGSGGATGDIRQAVTTKAGPVAQQQRPGPARGTSKGGLELRGRSAHAAARGLLSFRPQNRLAAGGRARVAHARRAALP